MIKLLVSNRESIKEVDVESYLSTALVLVMCLSTVHSIRRDFFRTIISLDGMSSWIIFISTTLISAAVFGFISVYISCGIISFVSKKLGGIATLNETVVSYTAGSLPTLIVYVITVVCYILLAITANIDSSNLEPFLASNFVIKATSIINLVGVFVSVIITPILIARVNRFSVIKGVLSYVSMVILPAIVILILIIINFM